MSAIDLIPTKAICKKLSTDRKGALKWCAENGVRRYAKSKRKFLWVADDVDAVIAKKLIRPICGQYIERQEVRDAAT